MRSDAPACPICGTVPEREDDLRVHLHVDHRKSDLVEILTGDVSEYEQDAIPASE